MISLIFDTETTGLPSKQLPPDHPEQARIMQIAMALYDDEREIGCFYSRLRPDNWPNVHPKAYEAHKLTLEMCDTSGCGQELALKVFQQFSDFADVLVAFNYKFDHQLINTELALANLTSFMKPAYCPMEILTPIMGLKRANGAAKWPNLTEALSFTHPGVVNDKAHDALGDVRATAKVWNYILKNKLVDMQTLSLTVK